MGHCGRTFESTLITLWSGSIPITAILGVLCKDLVAPNDRRHVADKRDELASSHSITLSARARTLSGMITPSALAVLRLISSSNFVGCSTGMSAGLAPLSILST